MILPLRGRCQEGAVAQCVSDWPSLAEHACQGVRRADKRLDKPRDAIYSCLRYMAARHSAVSLAPQETAMEFDDREYWEKLINRSVSRFFLLAALNQKAMHGYELARAISEACRGCCEPSDAMIYPALHDLLEGGYVEGLVEAQGARQRKVCRLTEKGQEAYRAAAAAWQSIIPALDQAVTDALGAIEAEDRTPGRAPVAGGKRSR